MVSMLVRQGSALVGFGVHMVINETIGALYKLAVPFARGSAVAAGMVHGVIWWVLGALVLMLTLLGMPQMVFIVK